MTTTRSQGLKKRVLDIRTSDATHWVGDGFPVRTLFSYHDSGQELSPFLLLDYGGPRDFPPTSARLGVGPHPHRGFETVTIVYAGEVEHRDSAGGGGEIGPGDVQWMTAGSGLIHEEFHGRAFARRGGPFEMVQLWVNLPAKDKLAPPRYQSLLAAEIPVVPLPDEQGEVRVIAGLFAGKQGPARTFTPIHVWNVRVRQRARLEVPEGFTTLIVVLKGKLQVNGSATEAGSFARLDPRGTQIELESAEGATLLVLSGQPIDEPIVGHGPFVMNTAREIQQAIVDYQMGKMGRLA